MPEDPVRGEAGALALGSCFFGLRAVSVHTLAPKGARPFFRKIAQVPAIVSLDSVKSYKGRSKGSSSVPKGVSKNLWRVLLAREKEGEDPLSVSLREGAPQR